MRKAEIKAAKDNELIVEYVQTYSLLMLNTNLQMGTKRHEKHCQDLETELVKRGLLTEEDVKHLNM